MKRRLYVSVKHLEVDRPDGGGQGRETPYILFLSIDGRLALQLTHAHFREAGQMVALAEILKSIAAIDPSGNPPPLIATSRDHQIAQ